LYVSYAHRYKSQLGVKHVTQTARMARRALWMELKQWIEERR
jgi:hypothetical protein